MCSMAAPAAGGRRLDDLDCHVGRIGHDVVHGRAFLRLRDERLDVLLRGVGIDMEGDLDVVVTVTDVAVDAQDAVQIHLALELGLDRAQLDAAVLRYGRHARRQAARKTHQHQLDGGRAVVLGGENLRVIGLERELALMPVLVTEPMEPLHGRSGVGTGLPLAGCTPGELCGLGCALQRFPCRQQCIDVDPVVDTLLSHFRVSSKMWKVLCTALARCGTNDITPGSAGLQAGTDGPRQLIGYTTISSRLVRLAAAQQKPMIPDSIESPWTASVEQSRRFGFETRQLHAGQRPDPNTGARAVPIFQTTSYVFEDPAAAAAYFNLQEYGNTYTRIMNPTLAVFEERVASLEGGCGAVAFASGLAAQAAALFTLLTPGDHVVSSAALYGGTVNQFKHVLRKLNVELTWVDPDDPSAWETAVQPNTKAFFGETIGNPGGNVLDIEAIAAVAHEHGLPLLVDNTFATPYLCRPIEWGADIVIHSATKFIGGHGTSIGGVVVEAGTFDWSNGRFPVVADPSPAYHGLAFYETFGMYGYLMKLRAESLRDLGGAMSPFNAFLFLLGLETLPLRMDRHVSNAVGVARYLQKHPQVERVRYAGLEESPYHGLVEKYLPRGAGAVFSFDCAGGRDGGQDLIRGVTLWSHLANVGDAKSLIIHPASTTHRQLGDDELRAAGVGPGTVRLSVGTESVEDLIWDLRQGFALVAATAGKKVGTS